MKKDVEIAKENNNFIINNKTLTLKNKTESIVPIVHSITNTQSISKYLKSITIFNDIPKGKVISFNKEISYNFNKLNNKLLKQIYEFLFYSFFSMNSLISKPVLEITSNKIIIRLFFYHFNLKKLFNRCLKKTFKNRFKYYQLMKSFTENRFLIVNIKKLNLICKILSRHFKKPVELNLTKLNYPYLDSNIFVNLLALMINKKKLRNIMKRFFKFAVIKNINKLNHKKRITHIPSYLSGIKIYIGGRLLTNRVVPRKTVKIIRRGAFARSKVNFLDIARYTNKNRRGSFSITVSTGQNLII